jgi:type II secretory pathway pseudopilin PulG
MNEAMTQARREDGFALVEAIVSAAVLAIVALAVLAGIDGATASTARERARAVASTLAEQQQERTRSYRFDELTKLAEVTDAKDPRRNVEEWVDGVRYNVNTEVKLQVDGSGTPTTGCGSSGAKQKEYLKVVTTVTSAMVGGTDDPVAPTNGRIQAVKIESLVAPPVSGSLVVKVLDAKNNPVSGVDVDAVAKSGRLYEDVTSPEGCALFVGIESGSYTIEITKAGYVDRLAQSPGTTTTSVSPNLVNVVTMTFDRAVDLTVNVKTLVPGATFPSATTFNSTANAVSDNSADPNTLRTYTPASPASTIIAPKVFPFTSGYSFFTGKCGSESPVKPVSMKDYFSTTNPKAVVIADADKTTAELTATVYQPALNLRLNSTSDLSGTYKAYAWLVDGCADFQGTRLTIKTWPSAWGTAPTNASRNWIGQAGTDSGLPFGTYRICVQNGSNNWLQTPVTYDNTKTHQTGITTISTSGGSYGSNKPSGC